MKQVEGGKRGKRRKGGKSLPYFVFRHKALIKLLTLVERARREESEKRERGGGRLPLKLAGSESAVVLREDGRIRLMSRRTDLLGRKGWGGGPKLRS